MRVGWTSRIVRVFVATLAVGCSPSESGVDGTEGDSSGSGSETGAEQPWGVPACEGAEDLPITIHHLGDGDDIALREGDLGCGAIVPLAVGNELLAICDGDLFRSVDAGCTWASLDPDCDYETIVAAPGHGAYGLCRAMGVRRVARIDGAEIDHVEVDWQSSQLAVDPQDRNHVLLLGLNAAFHRSHDGGDTWAQAGTLPSTGEYPGVRTIAVDPADIDHFVTSDWDAVWHTSDGGASFTQATFGFAGDSYGLAYIDTLAPAPGDGTRILATGSLRGDDTEIIADSAGVYLSTDGGVTFEHTEWPNGHPLFVHPTAPDVYFFFELLGGDGMDVPPSSADLVRVAGGASTRVHASGVLRTMAFSPADPDLLYLGAMAPLWGG